MNSVLRAIKPVSSNARTVTLSRADYEALMDAMEDTEAHAAFLATRGEETFPAAVARDLAAGVVPVLVFRKHRNMTLAGLSEASGISKSYLSEIETGRKPGSAKTLAAIATALGVTIEDLI